MQRLDATKAPTASHWLAVTRANPRAELRLFCFPYAGGDALVYRGWAEALPDSVEVVPVQLPGRGKLRKESPATRHETLIPALASALAPHLDKPFAFFGHSMGATIAFELTRRLRRERRPLPFHLLASGSPAPQLPDRHPRTFDLPEPEFIEELRRLNGTPREVLEDPELMALLLPVLRADFELVQTYVYADGPPLECPITALGGAQDTLVPREDLEVWGALTCAPFELRVLPGDHFFLHASQRDVLGVVSDALQGGASTAGGFERRGLRPAAAQVWGCEYEQVNDADSGLVGGGRAVRRDGRPQEAKRHVTE